MAAMEGAGGGKQSAVVAVLRLGDDVSQRQRRQRGNRGEEGVMVKRG